jgi:ribulose-bisphosphate carboxylase large chain
MRVSLCPQLHVVQSARYEAHVNRIDGSDYERKHMTLPERPPVPGLSGERFNVTYLLTGSEDEARALAEVIKIEQSVEFPAALIPDGDIRDHLVGRVEAFKPAGEGSYYATISFAVEGAGRELTQLLNMMWGTGSLLSNMKVDRVKLPDSLLAAYRGPRFGTQGFREILQVWDRPLLCTAIKPMGLSPADLAEMAYRCALGGIDIIKDDHGITDQTFCPFEARVPAVAEAVARANQQTGLHCVYAANVTGPADRIVERALVAKQSGATALLISPALTGFDAMRTVADDDRIALPLISHPAHTGHYVVSPTHGFSYYAFYGQIQRLAGADASIYVNYGGRFDVTAEDCKWAARGCRDRMGPLKPILPALGGGMTPQRIPALLEMYGMDAIFLVGGGLHSRDGDLVERARRMVAAVQGVR